MSAAAMTILTNGLRVVTVPCEAESVAFGLFVASGSRHEDAASAGISHFIEHMLFKGTPSRSALDITRAIEGRGGNFNACTGEEATCYYAHMPSECLAEAVDILGDMYLNASIAGGEFRREREVIVEEIRMYADEPDSVAMENLQHSLFPGHPLGLPVAGTPESLGAMTPEAMRRYIRSHYTPDRTVAVVVGAFDPAEALKLVAARLGKTRRHFCRRTGQAFTSNLKPQTSNLKPQTSNLKPQTSNLKPAFQPVGGESSVTRDVQQAQLALGYRTFGIGDGRRYAATVLDAVLGRGMSSRLFQEVREKRGLSYDISSRMHFFNDAGMFTVTAGMDASRRERALSTIDRELGRTVSKRVGAAELRRTKDFLVGNFRLGHERVTSKLFFYGQSVLAFGRVVEPREQVDGIAAVSSDDVLAAARAIFRPESRSVSWVLPRQV